MKTGLLSALRKYRPRENSDPLENFITEAFAWLLNSYPNFGEFFLKKVIHELKDCKVDKLQNLIWSTQENFAGKYPDMFCQVGDVGFVFEHKAWSKLHTDQLKNYREYKSDTFSQSYVILITATVQQHDQNPDFAFCWYDIYKWIDEWKKTNDAKFMLDDFQELLLNEGMGPPAEISHEAILSYFPASSFRHDLSQLIKRAKESVDWENLVRKGHFKLTVPNKRGSLFGDEWGRIGINLLDGWHPGVFVGFLLDEWDHKVPPLNPQSPDCSIIIDIDQKFHKVYPENKYYLELVRDLSIKASALGWDFHNHIESHEDPNYWHPIHIRVPILELFRGTKGSEEQDKRFKGAVTKVLKVMKDCESFWKLRECLKLI